MSYTCFFFDVDGTLFDNGIHAVPESTIDALKRLKEKNKKCIICTGRGMETLKLVPQWDCIEWDGYILYNGALCLDKEGKVLKMDTLDSSILQQIEKVSNEHDIVMYYEGLHSWMNKPLNEKAIRGLQFMGWTSGFDVRDIEEDVCTMMAFDDDFSMFESIKGISIYPTPHHYADIGIQGISKGSGIQTFIDYFNISKENTMGFGDGNNDVEMIEAVGMGVAMGQGTQNCKNAANYITEPVNQDGLYKALEHFHCL